ncbi:uncharacterized protein LOC131928516 [Physella acuta]|uniref:uncharacterized protein LOC131928516 n=1 Tax=Physella acuta TaxID=109671 RepID=UPI0027DD78AE|nr:uncharacterized protein LOC131928516 [Physella acuta]
MTMIVIICSSLFVTADVIGQNVVLLPYDRAYSQSACRDGLRHGEDKMVFTALVNFTHLSDDWSRTVRFHSTDDRDQNFTYLCAVNLTKGCNRTHRIICYCNTTDDDGIHHIIVNITALSSYSHSGLQAYLVHSNLSRMYSGIQHFPKVSGNWKYHFLCT